MLLKFAASPYNIEKEREKKLNKSNPASGICYIEKRKVNENMHVCALEKC